MKVEDMNCRQVEAKLADWSADNLPDSFCEELSEHLRQCPPCAQHWNAFEKTLHVVSTSTQPCCSAERTHAMWKRCERHIEKKVESERATRNHSARAWWQLSPRLGFTSLAGAFTVLIAVWLAPTSLWRHSNAVSLPASHSMTNIKAPQDEWIRFALPPSQASPFINHHAAMAFDPFADHVASTLVSDEATNSMDDASNVAPFAFSSASTPTKSQRP